MSERRAYVLTVAFTAVVLTAVAFGLIVALNPARPVSPAAGPTSACTVPVLPPDVRS